MKNNGLLAAATVSCLLVSPLAMSRGPESISLWYQADITIGLDGRLSALQWRDAREQTHVVVDHIEPVVRGWEYRPGELAGQPAETTTVLNVQVEANALPGGSYALSVASASTGPAADRTQPPPYPRDALHRGISAEVRLEIAVDESGAVSTRILDFAHDGRANQWIRKDFEHAAVQAASRWTIHQERVGGHPVAASFRVPITFCVGGNPWCEQRRPASADGRTATSLRPGTPIADASVAAILSEIQAAGI